MSNGYNNTVFTPLARRFRAASAIAALWLVATPASAQRLTLDLEIKLVPNVGAAWQTVTLQNSYTNPVVVCSYNLPSSADNEAVTRIQSVTSTSFQLRVQQFENSSAVTASNVHCIIADAGSYNLGGGLKFDAGTVLSDQTSGLSVPDGWNLPNLEEITGAVGQSYSNPVVLGQVMSFSDSNASVFWTNNCTNRNRSPFQTNNRVCVGKHIGQINGTRAPETLGYIIVEAGSGTVNDIDFSAALGADTVTGVGNSPPYIYNLSDDFDIGVVTQAGEDGGQGGWAVLYGADPLPANRIQLAVDEETVAGDMGRTHTTEQIGYWVFKDEQSVSLDASKDVVISTASVSPYAIPGSDVVYTITVENTGSGPVDNNSMFIADAMPPEAIFYNGDIDDGGPLTDSVVFTSTGSGLTFNPATDLAFSNGATRPASFAACTYTPAAGYDPDVTYICLSPKGTFNDGGVATSEFSIDFRAQIE